MGRSRGRSCFRRSGRIAHVSVRGEARCGWRCRFECNPLSSRACRSNQGTLSRFFDSASVVSLAVPREVSCLLCPNAVLAWNILFKRPTEGVQAWRCAMRTRIDSLIALGSLRRWLDSWRSRDRFSLRFPSPVTSAARNDWRRGFGRCHLASIRSNRLSVESALSSSKSVFVWAGTRRQCSGHGEQRKETGPSPPTVLPVTRGLH